MEARQAFLKVIQRTSWISFQKQAEVVSGSAGVTEELKLDV